MLYLVIFIFVILLVIILFLSMKANIVIEYNRVHSDDSLVISFFMLGEIIKLKYEIPLIDLGKGGLRFVRIREEGKKEKDIHKKKEKDSFLSIYQKLKDAKCFYDLNRDFIKKITCYLKRKLIVKEFNLNIRVGTDDVFYTGILSGILWSISGIIISYLCSNLRVMKRHVDIQSNFNEKEMKADFYCIINVKFVHIIVVRMKVFLYTRKKKSCKDRKTGFNKTTIL